MSVNKVILVGRLGQDPELKYTQGGGAVCQFSLATSEFWQDKQGQRQEKTEWHRIVVWGKLAETCNQYLGKGRQAYVEGRLQTRSWEDKEGQKRYTTEIVANSIQFLGGKESGATTSRSGSDQHAFSDVGGSSSSASSASVDDFDRLSQSNPNANSKANSNGGGDQFAADEIPF